MIAIVFGGVLDRHCSNMTSYSINALCEMFNNDVVIIDFFKSNQLQKMCGEHKYIKCTFDNCNDYKEVYQQSQEILDKYKIDKIIWYRQMMYVDYRATRYYLATYLERRIRNGNYAYVSYIQSTHVHKRYIFMKACSKRCKVVVQFLQDINEFTFDKTMNFSGKFYKTYLAKTGDFIFMPTFEQGLSLYNNRTKEKKNDFVFWCTAKTDDRKYLSDRKEELESLGYDIKIVCIGDKFGTISEEEYDNKLAQSLFTLCVPAYNQNNFSIWRIIEALSNDCLCLVLANNNLYDLRCTYPDICDIIQTRNLILDDFTNLQKKIEELKPQRENILNELKETESFKKITDFDWCRSRWHRMLEVKDG